jgi:hypothetical protein
MVSCQDPVCQLTQTQVAAGRVVSARPDSRRPCTSTAAPSIHTQRTLPGPARCHARSAPACRTSRCRADGERHTRRMCTSLACVAVWPAVDHSDRVSRSPPTVPHRNCPPARYWPPPPPACCRSACSPLPRRRASRRSARTSAHPVPPAAARTRLMLLADRPVRRTISVRLVLLASSSSTRLRSASVRC